MMISVISVRFRNGSKTYYFDPKDVVVKAGQDVIVETSQGLEFAQCTAGNHDVDEEQVVQPLRPMIRIATENDRRTAAYHREREKEAFDICQKKILQHKLDMKLVRVECSFDGNKILFFFTADGRVDFRDLVKDLASVFRSRIELRQIGVRDEAKMLGGLGICGRPFCCAQFMDDFVPVSIKMAKTQNLSLNPTKISGTCGRLMCCLKYEQEAYEDAIKRMPKNESFVMTPDGPGNVSDVNLLKETVNVRLDDHPEAQKCYHNCEVCVLRNGKGSRDGIDVPEERPERYIEQSQEEFVIPPIIAAFDSSDAAVVSKNNAEKRSRRSRRNRGRGGKKPSGEQSVTREAAKPAEKKEEKTTDEHQAADHNKPHHSRRHRHGSGKNGEAQKQVTPVKAVAVPSAEGGDAVHKKPRHRGGRRHNHNRSNAPKTEN